MEVKDLMLGDWVNYKSPSSGKLQPIKINNIYGAEFNCEVEDWNIISGKSISDTEPIELTEEVLVKNGFECERNVGYIFDDYEGNEVIYDDYNNRLKILQNHDVSFNREYFSKVCVHHLQHALRLCEIRKEIEL